MFEAKLADGYIFKRIVEAIKDLVTDVNLDVSPSGKYSHLQTTNTFSNSLYLGKQNTAPFNYLAMVENCFLARWNILLVFLNKLSVV